MLGGIGVHRANQGELVGTGAEPAQLGTQLQARQVGRRRFILATDLIRHLRLHVIHVDMTGTALQEHEDHVDLSASTTGSFVCQQLREGKPEWRDRTDRQASHAEELAAIGYG